MKSIIQYGTNQKDIPNQVLNAYLCHIQMNVNMIGVLEDGRYIVALVVINRRLIDRCYLL